MVVRGLEQGEEVACKREWEVEMASLPSVGLASRQLGPVEEVAS